MMMKMRKKKKMKRLGMKKDHFYLLVMLKKPSTMFAKPTMKRLMMNAWRL